MQGLSEENQARIQTAIMCCERTRAQSIPPQIWAYITIFLTKRNWRFISFEVSFPALHWMYWMSTYNDYGGMRYTT